MLYQLNRRLNGPHSRCGYDVEENNWFASQESNHDLSDFQSVLYFLHPAFKHAELSCITYISSFFVF